MMTQTRSRVLTPDDAEIADHTVQTGNIGILEKLIPKTRMKSRVLGLDPGETTGSAIMEGASVIHSEQLRTKNMEEAISVLHRMIREWNIFEIACEDYRVYAWESDKHKWAALHTPKLVGAIQTVAWFNKAEVTLRMAIQAKQFVTDEKLVAWGLWKRGERHSRDAIRHAVYHQIFGPGK